MAEFIGGLIVGAVAAILILAALAVSSYRRWLGD